jgi:hypothetical protein
VTRVTQGGCGDAPPQGVPLGATPVFVISYVRTLAIRLALQAAKTKRAGFTVSTGRGQAVAMSW